MERWIAAAHLGEMLQEQILHEPRRELDSSLHLVVEDECCMWRATQSRFNIESFDFLRKNWTSGVKSWRSTRCRWHTW